VSKPSKPRRTRRKTAHRLRILAFDIGGTHLKAALIDADGRMLSDKLRVKTPDPCPPRVLVDALVEMVRPLPRHDRIAIGFPGRIWHGRVLTAPNLGGEEWENVDLAGALSRRLGGAPARVVHDAEMQGLGVIKGKGVEFVLTLGTGAGTGLFRDGEVMPHLELAHHPIVKNKTYEDYIGDAALKKDGRKRWSKHVAHAVDVLYQLIHYDRMLIGGGNAGKISVDLPDNVTLVSNVAGIKGGAGLWRDAAGDPAGKRPAKTSRRKR
jgi:polyphosphate glucokinase